ncbi:type II/IV secretion system protein [Candidatus Poribacteria bacterium]|nr:type II/IV secretion system protein [Candidatus Poribacteria bacterium]
MIEYEESTLIDMLMEAGAFTEEERAEAEKYREENGISLKEALIERDHITQEDIDALKQAAELGFEYKRLEHLSRDESATALMPANFAADKKVVPLKLENNILHVAMTDPLDVGLIDDIRLITETEIQPVLSQENDILDAIRRFYGMTAEDIINRNLDVPIGVTPVEEIEAIEDFGLDSETLAQTPTVIHYVDQLIIDAVREKATDIHIEPMEKNTRIRFRVDGVLQERPVPPKNIERAIISRVKIMSHMNIAERRRPQDGSIQRRIPTLGNREIDIRVSTVPTFWGETVAMRILDKTIVSFGLEELGMLEDNMAQFRRLINRPHGIILTTGPTGSGKTTTIYACLKEINTPEIKILTVEEPVEYDLPGINQIGVNTDIGITFANTLRHILRQDPDKIMVGEIRDSDTAEMAIHAALTGHLVFSSLHTNDAAGAVTRLIDMGVQPYLVASSLEGIAAQRLVRRVCRRCREMYHPDDTELRDLGVEPGTVDADILIPKPVGCPDCNYRGYSGRVALYEIIIMSDDIRDMAYKEVPTTEIRKVARKHGMRTLREDGWLKVMRGVTTIEEVRRVTADEEYSTY